MAYQPIENYGLIGNLRTAALVGLDGSIDWLCLPRFDSPSVFGAILDDRKGGRFRITAVEDDCRRKQFYWPDTNVLVTRFQHAGGVAELVDFMPVDSRARLFRRVQVTRGRLRFRMDCLPAFDYARVPPRVDLLDHGVCFEGAGLRIALRANVGLQRADGGVFAEFELGEGEETTFALRLLESEESADEPCPDGHRTEELFRETVSFWRRWLAQSTYRGRWREIVNRSALALKLLTYAPTGAIVAAPTCGLPEAIGGARNWDYRYTWIRDAAFTVYAFVRLGFTEEAAAFVGWLEHLPHGGNDDPIGPVRPVYRIDGGTDLDEEILEHLDGYRGSRPVRIGNDAVNQLQLDIYGEKLDAVYLANKYAAPLAADTWMRGVPLLDWLADNWRREDEGIWEYRNGRRQHTYSKLMCWVAFDRALRLAEKRSFPAPREKWLRTRDEIFEAILRDGWSDERKAFTQAFGGNTLDAANLLMPLVFFTGPNDPRLLSTIDAVMKRADQGGLRADGLIYRYTTPDGYPEQEGTFNLCTFWLVEALTRAGRTDPARLDEARLMFERMLGYSNHLGLYAEQTGLGGEALGNYPQAFTHLALISAAFNLDRELSR